MQAFFAAAKLLVVFCF